MNYNVKVGIERFNGKYNSTVELSGPGRSGVRRSSTATFEESLKQTKAHHDELLALVEAYHNPPELAAQREAEAKAKAEAEKAAAKAAKKAPKPAAKKNTKKDAEASKGGDGKDSTGTPKKTAAQKAPAKRKFAAD